MSNYRQLKGRLFSGARPCNVLEQVVDTFMRLLPV